MENAVIHSCHVEYFMTNEYFQCAFDMFVVILYIPPPRFGILHKEKNWQPRLTVVRLRLHSSDFSVSDAILLKYVRKIMLLEKLIPTGPKSLQFWF
jgi:hypothetical protein